MFNRFQTRQDLIPNPNPNIMRTIIRKLPPLRTKGCFAPQVVFETMILHRNILTLSLNCFFSPICGLHLILLRFDWKPPVVFWRFPQPDIYMQFSRVKLLRDTRCKSKTVTTLFNCPSFCPVFWGYLNFFFTSMFI